MEKRKEVLRSIIQDLHKGGDPAVLRERFAELLNSVGATEISELEQSLIDEGLPESEIQRLCDLHVQVFKGSLDRLAPAPASPSHPVHTFRLENEEASRIVSQIQEALSKESGGDEDARARLLDLVERLAAIDLHYLRKENQLFPVLEARGITGPPQVMWGIHDEIRKMMKDARLQLGEGRPEGENTTRDLADAVGEMIYKEENILFPMSIDKLTEEDWARVGAGEDEIGYAWVKPAKITVPERSKAVKGVTPPGMLSLSTGQLTPEEIDLMLTNLPVDLSYVDSEDRVRYYSESKERLFPRSPGVIGRKVQNCHPPKSVDVVNRILDEFRAGTRDVAEFWIRVEESFIHIRYIALRDAGGKYRGTLEVSQEVSGIRKLEGEKRLLDW